jgi:hypothetical protein
VELELRGASRLLGRVAVPRVRDAVAEATMAEPVGPVTLRCPLAVRSTCPPARCTAATISLASLDRQRFGAGCSSAPYQMTSASKDPSMTSSWTAHPLLAAPSHRGATPADTADGSSRSVRAGPCHSRRARASTVDSGRQRIGGTAGHRPSSSCSRDDVSGRFRLWSLDVVSLLWGWSGGIRGHDDPC